MKYYLLQTDKADNGVPRLINWTKVVDSRKLCPENYSQIPEITLLNMECNSDCIENEIIVSPFLLLPKEAAKLLKMFEPDMYFKEMPCINQIDRKVTRYQFPLLRAYDCIHEESKLNQDRSIINECVLIKEKLPDRCLFLLKNTEGRHIIIRQDYLECLLKRHIFGFSFMEVKLS